jgi:hypothetical protein
LASKAALTIQQSQVWNGLARKLPHIAGEAEALFALELVIENGQDAAMDVAG